MKLHFQKIVGHFDIFVDNMMQFAASEHKASETECHKPSRSQLHLFSTYSVLNSLAIRNMNSCLGIHFLFTFLEFYTTPICHTCGRIKDV
jgi:hypothetical protein